MCFKVPVNVLLSADNQDQRGAAHTFDFCIITTLKCKKVKELCVYEEKNGKCLQNRKHGKKAT